MPVMQAFERCAIGGRGALVRQQEGQGDLAGGEIGSQCFPRRFLIAKHVQAIVEHLVGRSEGDAKLAESLAFDLRRAGQQGTQFAGQGEELAVLSRMTRK